MIALHKTSGFHLFSSIDVANPGNPLGKGQFRLADRMVPEWGEPQFSIDGLYLWQAGCPLVIIRDETGASIGCLLGTPIDYRRCDVIREEIVFDSRGLRHRSDQDAITTLEDWLYSFAGTWVAIVVVNGNRRLYVDTNATMGVVFDPASRLVGATAAAILDKTSYVERFRRELFGKMDVLGAGWFIAGLTAHRGVVRLLANHYLDLRDWSIQRHWPRETSIKPCSDEQSSLNRISEIIERQLGALLRTGSVCCSLTGGYETRALLACSREVRDSLHFATVAFSGTARDVYLATRLASRFRLKHSIYPERRAEFAEAMQWLHDHGHCVGGPLVWAHPSTAGLSEYDYFVGGLGGEVARGFFYRVSDESDSPLNARSLVSRTGLPPEATVVNAADQWLFGVPRLSSPEILDLAYVELRMGPWAFASVYPHQYTTEIHPMVCREIYELMFGLPLSSKRINPIREIVRLRGPELLQFPVNRYGDFRDVLSVLSKASEPKRVIKKLRKLWG